MLKVRRVFFFNSLGAFQMILLVRESAARPLLPSSVTWEKNLVQMLLKTSTLKTRDVFLNEIPVPC